MALVQVLSLCIFLNFRYLSQYSAQIYRAQYGAVMLVYLRGTPTWRPESRSGTYFGYLGDLLSALNKKHLQKRFSYFIKVLL